MIGLPPPSGPNAAGSPAPQPPAGQRPEPSPVEAMAAALEGPELSAASEAWLRLKEVFGGGRTSSFRERRRRAQSGSEGPVGEEQLPFGPHREPVSTGALLGSLFRRHGWARPIAQAEVIDRWPTLAGERIAAHARPLHVDDGVLVVQCDSTAWATQLRAIRSTIVAKIASEFPDAAIDDLRVLNPGAPSWRRGPRSVPGRGPRDTYG